MRSTSGLKQPATPFLALVAPLAAGLLLGGCAGAAEEGGLASLLGGKPQPKEAVASLDPKAELEKATGYWAKEFATNPRNPDAAVNYAKNLKALGERDRAIAALQQASMYNSEHKGLAGEYGRLALEADQAQLAEKLLMRAEDPTKPDHKVTSALGAAIAKQGRHREAIPHFERALVMSPDNPAIMSNLGMAHAMNGEAAKAEDILRKAVALPNAAPRVRQNLALVLGLQGKFEEAKQHAGADLAPEKAAANVAYLQKMVDAAPAAVKSGAAAPAVVAQAKPAKGGAKVAGAAPPAPALKGPTAPASSDVAASAWSTEVARASDAAPAGAGR